MVRANGQRDGVGRTILLASASEHAEAIVDPTRVSPYGPAGRDIPQSMRPDTRQHLTACTVPSARDVTLAHDQPRPSTRFAAPPLRSGPSGVTATAGRAGNSCRPAGRLTVLQRKRARLRKPPRYSGESTQQNSRPRSRRRSLQSRRRPHTSETIRTLAGLSIEAILRDSIPPPAYQRPGSPGSRAARQGSE